MEVFIISVIQINKRTIVHWLTVFEKMILSNDECVNPVPRDSDTSDENNNSMDFEITSDHMI